MKLIMLITLLVLSVSQFAYALNNVAEVTLSAQNTSSSLRLEHDEYKDIFEKNQDPIIPIWSNLAQGKRFH